LNIKFCFIFLRRKSFTLIDESSLNKNVSNEKSVHHVIIQDERTITHCSKFFPNANELTISDQRADRARRCTTDSLDRIIPLVQLTKITIDYGHRPFSRVIDLLYVTPNIHTLIFKRLSLVSTDYFPLQQSEKCQFVSKQNKIKHIKVLFAYSLRNIQLFLNLCPKLQQLSICASTSYLESTVQFLLTEIPKSTCSLSSICILEMNSIDIEKFKTLIESKKFLIDYSVKIIDKMFFIWS
jgi:hypothetical protein